MEGPDHLLSSEMDEMANLVEFKKFYNKYNIWFKKRTKKEKEQIKLILGDGIKKIQPNEYITINSQKKSLYAKKIIKMGDRFNEHNVTIKGPAGGLLPKYMTVILNRKAKIKIDKDEPITWKSF